MHPIHGLDLIIKLVIASIDSIELWVRLLRPDWRPAIERALGHPIEIRRCKNRELGYCGHRIIVNRPSLAVLPLLNDILNSSDDACVSRIDVAYDFRCYDPRLELTAYFSDHVVLKWGGAQRFSEYDEERATTTVNWKDFRGDPRRTRRSLTAYQKLENNSSRLEYRMLRAATKTSDLMQLVELNPRTVFLDNIKLLRLSDRYANHIKRKLAMKCNRLPTHSRNTNSLAFIKRQASAPQCRYQIEPFGMQEFHCQERDNLVGKVTEIDINKLLPTRLTWPDSPSNRDKYPLAETKSRISSADSSLSGNNLRSCHHANGNSNSKQSDCCHSKQNDCSNDSDKVAIMRMYLRNPCLTVEEIYSALIAQGRGVTVGLVRMIVADFRISCEVLADCGWIEPDLLRRMHELKLGNSLVRWSLLTALALLLLNRVVPL
jgi:hypothetical protein